MKKHPSTKASQGKASQILGAVLIVALSLTFSGCFQIYHFLQINADGTVDVQWRFIAPASPPPKKSASDGKPKKKDPLAEISDKVLNSAGALRLKLGKIADEVSVSGKENADERALLVKFKTKKGVRIPRNHVFPPGLPVYPDYDAAKGRMVFSFFPPVKKGGKELDNLDKKLQDQFAFLLVMVMSSSRYQILLSGAKVKKAYVPAAPDKDLILKPIALGDTTLINIPFMGALGAGLTRILKSGGGAEVVLELEPTETKK